MALVTPLCEAQRFIPDSQTGKRSLSKALASSRSTQQVVKLVVTASLRALPGCDVTLLCMGSFVPPLFTVSFAIQSHSTVKFHLQGLYNGRVGGIVVGVLFVFFRD